MEDLFFTTLFIYILTIFTKQVTLKLFQFEQIHNLTKLKVCYLLLPFSYLIIKRAKTRVTERASLLHVEALTIISALIFSLFIYLYNLNTSINLSSNVDNFEELFIIIAFFFFFLGLMYISIYQYIIRTILASAVGILLLYGIVLNLITLIIKIYPLQNESGLFEIMGLGTLVNLLGGGILLGLHQLAFRQEISKINEEGFLFLALGLVLGIEGSLIFFILLSISALLIGILKGPNVQVLLVPIITIIFNLTLCITLLLQIN